MGDAPGPDARPVRLRRRVVLAAVAVAVLGVFAIGAGLAVFRYLPAVDEARALRSDLEAMIELAQDTGLDIDDAAVDALATDLGAARTRLDHLRGLVAGDPLIAVARVLPPTSADVRAADQVLAAGDSLLDATGAGVTIARRFVAIRDAQVADPGHGALLGRLLELLVASRDEAAVAAASVEDARRALAAVPGGAIPQVDSIRDAMSRRVEQFGPLLDTYLDVSERLPAILGWDRPRRYLVLSQDPAELRPTGGLIGSFGIVVFDKGRISELRFADVDTLDFPSDFPRIEPPRDLADHLLDPAQPWELADAGWSPDFPTSARDALRLYTNESGDAKIDGVLGMTTYTIDELLKVTGPITVPEYAATIVSGQTTLKVLQLTREARSADQGRKAILSALADRLVDSLLALPPSAWAGLLDTADTMRRGHLLQAWFRDAADQGLAAATGFDGAVLSGTGDYVYPVDANVAPSSKLNLVTTRSLDLDVQLDELGNARHTLVVTWDNDVEAPGNAAYRAMVNAGGPVLGMYSRLLVPRGSRVDSVAGGDPRRVTAPAVQDEAGRTSIGSYLTIPPGSTTLRYAWLSLDAVALDATGGVYRLTIQKQPGTPPGPLSIAIRVPEGYRITAASPELTVSGRVATMTGTADGDLSVSLRYAP